jgi:hypothetical protein
MSSNDIEVLEFLTRFSEFLESDPSVDMCEPLEEVSARLQAQGFDLEALDLEARRLLGREGRPAESVTQVTPKPLLGQIRSGLLSLCDFPRLSIEPAPVLGDSAPKTDVRQIPLAQAFEISTDELELALPWCGLAIEIARTFTEEDHRPVYSAYATEPSTKFRVQVESDSSLLVTLKESNERLSFARLSAKDKEALFEGDRLSGELESIKVEIAICRE